MTAEQIREVVKITIDELTQRKLIKVDYQYTLSVIEAKLYAYFNDKSSGSKLSGILYQLMDDPYIDIIYLHYRDGKTLEWIAEFMSRDVSTIKRNKKRLILKINELLE